MTNIQQKSVIQIDTFREYTEYGLSVIGCKDDKTPVVSWDPYKSRVANEKDYDLFILKRATKAAIVCGAVSGNLLCIDFDLKYHPMGLHLFQSCLEKIIDYLGGGENLVIVKTPSGGRHLWVRSDDAHNLGNKKLAGRPTTEKERKENPKLKVLYFIEIRGEGGYAIVPPSPGYEFLAGSAANIPVLKLEQIEHILTICKSYTEIVDEESKPTKAESKQFDPFSETPLDAYNNDPNDPHIEVLEEAGWTHVSTTGERSFYRRPGSENTQSANWHHIKRIFYVFTSNSEFEPDKGYSPFGVLCKLKFNGDKKATIKWLVANGYGKTWTPQQNEKIEAVSIELDKGRMLEDVINDLLDSKIFTQDQIERVKEMTGDRHYVKTQLYFSLVRNAKGAMSVQISIHRLREFLMTIHPRINKLWRIARTFENRYLLIDEKTKIIQSIENYSDIAPLLANLIDDFISPVIDEDGSTWSELLKESMESIAPGKKKSLLEEMQKEGKDYLKYLKDDKYNSYTAFATKILKVNKSGYEFVDYGDQDGYIHKDSILDRKFEKPEPFSIGDFQKFFYRLCGLGTAFDEIPLLQIYSDPVQDAWEQIRPFVTGLAYLLHRFKDPTSAFAMELSEAVEDADNGGGTGKSLLGIGLSKVVNVQWRDGKAIENEKRFAFQGITSNTNVAIIDDATQDLDFEPFYNRITNFFEVEGKGKNMEILPFEDAPKVLIITNYQVRRKGPNKGKNKGAEEQPSTKAVHQERRLRRLKIAKFYSDNFSPKDEFTKSFFVDWDQSDWNRFYDFMFTCISIYFRVNRTVFSQAYAAMDTKKEIRADLSYGDEFLAFIDSQLQSIHKAKDYRWAPMDAYRKFLESNALDTKDLSFRTFKAYLEKYLTAIKVMKEDKTNPTLVYFFIAESLESWASNQSWYEPEPSEVDLPF